MMDLILFYFKTIFRYHFQAGFTIDVAKVAMALREEKIDQVSDIFTLFTGFCHRRFQK